MKSISRTWTIAFFSIVALGWVGRPLRGQNVQVTSATPPAAAPQTNVAIFTGPISVSKTSPDLTFASDPRLSSTGWSTNFNYGDMLGDGHTEILVGVPDANNSSSCNVNVGAAEMYFPSAVSMSQPTFTFQPSTVSTSGLYGWGVGLVSGSAGNPPLLLVGVSGPGQVYVYKKN